MSETGQEITRGEWISQLALGMQRTIDKQVECISELEAKLKDRHKRLNKAHDRNADLLQAVEEMDYVKQLRAKLKKVEALPDKWKRMAQHTWKQDLAEVALKVCADELQAIIKEQEDE